MEIEKILKTSFKNERQKAVINLRFTANFIGANQAQFMEDFDLSMQQFNILRILRGANEPLSVNVIRDRMVEKSPNTTRLLDKLMEKKLVDRVRFGDDRRVIMVSISPCGLKRLELIDKHPKVDYFLDFSEHITEEDAKQLNQVLDKLRGNIM